MRRPSLSQGFTLIEMLVSVLLIGVSVTLFGVLGLLFKSVSSSTYEDTAYRIAHTKLEELRAGGYASLSEGAFTDPALASIPSGSASTSVTTYNSKTKQVTAGVSWTGTGGAVRYVALTTLITEVGGL